MGQRPSDDEPCPRQRVRGMGSSIVSTRARPFDALRTGPSTTSPRYVHRRRTTRGERKNTDDGEYAGGGIEPSWRARRTIDGRAVWSHRPKAAPLALDLDEDVPEAASGVVENPVHPVLAVVAPVPHY